MKTECYQLDFFLSEEESEIQALRKEIVAIRESTSKVRKKLFAEQGKLMKITNDVRDRLEIIERNICIGEKNERRI